MEVRLRRTLQQLKRYAAKAKRLFSQGYFSSNYITKPRQKMPGLFIFIVFLFLLYNQTYCFTTLATEPSANCIRYTPGAYWPMFTLT